MSSVLKPFTVVFLRSNRFPRQTSKWEVQASDAKHALWLFMNHPAFNDRDLFVACVVDGPKELVSYTLKEDMLDAKRA